jgi:C-terminal processing protease CtpA/Prc
VRAASDRVTFVVQRHIGVEGSPARSISGTTISSVSKDISSAWGFTSMPDENELLDSSFEEEQERKTTKISMNKRMVADGSMVITQACEVNEPASIKTNESWKLSGAIIIRIRKSSASQKPGLRMGIKDTSTGRVLFVADISPSSPFARTPLRVGDVVLSINNVNLQENADVVDAYSALGKSGEEFSLVARKAEESLDGFLASKGLQSHTSDTSRRWDTESVSGSQNSMESSGTPVRSGSQRGGYVDRDIDTENVHPVASRHQPGPKVPPGTPRKSFEFSEESYGGSIYGYNSSRIVSVVKNDPYDDVGLGLHVIHSNLGRFLRVSHVVPHSKAASKDIKIGDVVLAINGVGFRDNPDIERALSLIKQARKEVIFEIQQLSNCSFAIPTVPVATFDEKGRTVSEPESVGVVRTRTFDSNDDFLNQTGTLKISGKLEPTMEEEELNESSLTVEASNLKGLRGTGELGTTGSLRSQEGDRNDFRRKTNKKLQRLLIVVTKDYQSQQVGIHFTTFNGKLLVTKVSPWGLLRGAPVIPGDTILSINKVSFRVSPDENKAFRVVNDSPRDVAFEILKTGKTIKKDGSGVSTKSCLVDVLRCGRRPRDEDSVCVPGNGHHQDDADTLSMIEDHDSPAAQRAYNKIYL